jgi:dihydroflavonol-4-reductase
MKTTIAITGASGHIGNVVCRMLAESGNKVRALYHTDRSSLEGIAVELIRGDVLNRDDLSSLIEGCEVVIHCAAIISIHGDPDGMVFKTNTEGTKNVLEVSKQLGVRKIIHLSSVHAVEEHPLTAPYDESRPYKTAAADSYDYSKALGEQLMLENKANGYPEVVVLRPTSVVGPYDFKPSEMGKALIDFYRQKIPALPAGGYDFVDVRDVALSVIAAIENGKSGEAYLLSGKYYTLKDLALLIQKVTGKKVPRLVIPYSVLKTLLPLIKAYSTITGAAPSFTLASINTLRNCHNHMDHSKATRQLGLNCRPMEETLRDFYEWQRSNNFIS